MYKEREAQTMGNREKEVETIKERNLIINLSNEDCRRLINKAAEHGLTAAELIEIFIGDLVNGTYSNGSDERRAANEWLERCGYSMTAEQTFKRYLLLMGELETCLENLFNMQEYKEALEELEERKDPEDELEIASLKLDIAHEETQLKEFYNDYAERSKGEPIQEYNEAITDLLNHNRELQKLLGE